MQNALRDYLKQVRAVRSSGQATEPSYYPAVGALIDALGGKDVTWVNQPKAQHYGVPDFIVQRDGVPIGHIECKDIGSNLDVEQETSQLRRYRDALPNLILTDFLEFRWFVEGEWRSSGRIATVGDSTLHSTVAARQSVGSLLGSFFAAELSPISSTADLAQRLAGLARLLRVSLESLLGEKGNDTEELRDLMEGYREVLISDLDVSGFADLQAQTVAYGMFAARCLHDDDPKSFSRESAVFAQTTPFLREVFGRIAGPYSDSRITWIVDHIARLMSHTDMASILERFAERAGKESPVVHFYEDFLTAYDPSLREERGVYYTPDSIVSYIVKSVDYLLRDHFGIANGLANKELGQPYGEGDAERQAPRVLILDPAVGTGSFLSKVVSVVREDVEERKVKGGWEDYLRTHLLPRLFGFELLMAPYAIAHLKLAIEVGSDPRRFTMPSERRLNVFLTNALEEAHESVGGQLFAANIAKEARQADLVKRNHPVMVVLGNPPYSGHSSNKGEWISELVEEYTRGVVGLDKPGQGKWLNDDYVKFIRFAQWRIDRTGEGILAFVTNHGYLENPTFRGMRQSLMQSFDRIWILDLHGNKTRRERPPGGQRDENVFEIKQGVAIAVFVKSPGIVEKPAKVLHAERWGERGSGEDAGKYAWLSSHDISNTEWQVLEPADPFYFFVPRSYVEEASFEYDAAWSIDEIFSPQGEPRHGIVTTHDQFAISWNADDAKEKVGRLLATETESEARQLWRLCSQDQWRYERAKQELASGEWQQKIDQVLYRPFDVRTTVYDRNVAVHRRTNHMRHMFGGENIGLCVGKNGQVTSSPIWDLVAVSEVPADYNLFRRGGNCLFPLLLFPEGGGDAAQVMALSGAAAGPNISSAFTEALEQVTGFKYVGDADGDLEISFAAKHVLYYVVAILHSVDYRVRFAQHLKAGFPKVPLPGTGQLFRKLVFMGKEIVELQLFRVVGERLPDFEEVGSGIVERVDYRPAGDGVSGRVQINEAQWFDGVSPTTWAFTVGGYRPAERWLSEGKGRQLGYEDVEWYRRIVGAIGDTTRIMGRVDAAIEEAGGWPLGEGN